MIDESLGFRELQQLERFAVAQGQGLLSAPASLIPGVRMKKAGPSGGATPRIAASIEQAFLIRTAHVTGCLAEAIQWIQRFDLAPVAN
jgi:hypothetical protein